MSGDDSHDTVLELLLDHLKNTLEKCSTCRLCMHVYLEAVYSVHVLSSQRLHLLGTNLPGSYLA